MADLKPSSRVTGHERRQVRLRLLLGQGVAEIAGAMGRDRSTIYFQISKYDLDAPPAPLELVRLELELAYEALALRGLSEALSPAERALMLKMSTELRQLEKRAAQEDEERGERNTGGARDEIKWDADGLWSRETCETVLEQLQAFSEPEPAPECVETKSQPGGNDDDRARAVRDVCPRGANAARGRVADMVVHGRTWRWQDARGSRMGALGYHVGSVWPRGSDRPGAI